MSARRRYSRDFKLEAIELWKSSGKSASEVEDELGLTRGRLYEWKHKLMAEGEETLQPQGHTLSMKEELRIMRRQLKIVTEERDILKKAVAIVSERKS